MDLELLHEFAVLAETKNYWQAAERLNMNQSTLSKHIKTLETALEVPLFRRTTRSVELTDYGLTFLPYAHSIIRLQFEYANALRRQKDTQAKNITVGCLPTMAQYGFVGLLVEYYRMHPDITIKVQEADPSQMLSMLETRKCDLIFCGNSSDLLLKTETGLMSRIPYGRDRLVAVVGEGHPLAGRGVISLKELQNERLCFFAKGSWLYDLCRSACQDAGFVPFVVFDSSQIENIFHVTADGAHATLLMSVMARQAVQAHPQGSFSLLEIAPEITGEFSIFHLQDPLPPPAALQFIQFCREQIDARSTDRPLLELSVKSKKTDYSEPLPDRNTDFHSRAEL